MDIKKIGVAILIILVLAGLGYWYIATHKVQDDRMIFFYRNDCPHCKNVEDFVAANKIEEKITFEKLEVSTDISNSGLLFNKANICGIDSSAGIGVPFFWNGKDANLKNSDRCILGDQPIIDYLSKVTGLTK